MKIALISLARRGGMVHFQAELANALVDIAPTAAICSSEAPSSLISPAVHRLALHTGSNSISSFFRGANPATWFAISRVIRDIDPDVVHVVGAHEWNPLVSVLVKLARKPLVYTMHDPVPHPGTSLAMRSANRIAARMADAIIVLTRSGRDQLISGGFSGAKVFHIRHGVYSFFTQWRHGSVRSEKVILYFGRMEGYKGLDILLAAFAKIRGSLPGWKLVLAGSGALPSVLAQAGHTGVEVLNRYIPDAEVASLMQRARLVVVPYTTATQSGAVAAAYAFGRPVIGTNVGGLREMVINGKTGLVIPPSDVPALARAIKKLATQPARLAGMRRNVLTLARGAWSWRRIAQEHARLYRLVLARSEVQ